MDDLIKRSEAIDAIRQWVKMYQYYHPHSKGKTIPVDEAIDELERVQAEQPQERRTGRWTKKTVSSEGVDEWQAAKCSACGRWHTTPYAYYFSHHNYCPHCGARMEAE